ncbi:hypothetical protein DEH18_09910 [Streptomyces sp. NHF165]|nr:hypothetical protein DEH18_09910 [Streptomyces sp. NHF165]
MGGRRRRLARAPRPLPDLLRPLPRTPLTRPGPARYGRRARPPGTLRAARVRSGRNAEEVPAPSRREDAMSSKRRRKKKARRKNAANHGSRPQS